MQSDKLTLVHVVHATSLSSVQIYNMERAGLFPKRIKLSGIRGFWSGAAVRAWMQQCLDTRPQSRFPRLTQILPGDRFVSLKEAVDRSGLGEDTLLRMERKETFPGRIAISAGRHAWLLREILQWRAARTDAAA